MASMLYQHLPHVVGVVGSGQMGAGIVQLCAIRGMEVLLSDRKHDLLNHGLATVQRIMDKQIRKGLLTADDAHAAMGRIQPSVSLEPFKRADFVFEAVSEDEELKKNVFRKLDQVTPVQTILASNTSSISVTRLAAVTSKPHRVIGMHFIHPVSDQPLCELSKGIHTSHGSFLAAKSLAEHMGKQVSVSEDRPGFTLFRNLLPFINEAFFTVMEGVASADDVDRCLRLGTGMRLGPLKLADSIGLDTCLSIMKVLHQNLGDSKYRPCPLLVQYVDAGWLGVKTGKGVFHYPREDARPDSLDMEKLIAQAHAHHHHLGSAQHQQQAPPHDPSAPAQLQTLPPPPLPQQLQRASSSSSGGGMPAL